MPGQRAKNKVQVGAYIDLSTDEGIQLWLKAHNRHTRTDFLQEAILEKLRRENIPVDPDAGSRQRPMRDTLALNEAASSEKTTSAAAAAGKKVSDMARKPRKPAA